MTIGILQIYKTILPSLSDERIVNLMQNNFIRWIIMQKIVFLPESTIEGLNLINSVIKLAGNRPQLAEKLIKDFEVTAKVYLPSRIVEKFTAEIFENLMSDGKWHEVSRRPMVKVYLEIIRNTLNHFPVHLDDTWLNNLFYKFLAIPMSLYRSHLDHLKPKSVIHVNSSNLKLIFGVLIQIAVKTSRINFKDTRIKDLMFWAIEDNRKYKSLPWMIIAQVTKNKDGFQNFTKEYQQVMQVPLVNTVINTILISKTSPVDLKVVVAVFGNILDFSDQSIDISIINLIVDKISTSKNHTALSFIVKKIIQNDMPGSFELITSRGIIKKFLKLTKNQQEITDQFEAIATCHRFKPLTKHVTDTVTSDVDMDFMYKLCDTKKETSNHSKQFKTNAFNILLILMTTETGIMKIARSLSNPKVIDRLMYASHDSLRFNNHFNDIMFMLRFWNLLIDACDKFDSPIINTISSHVLDVVSGECIFFSQDSDEKGKVKIGSILEKEFNKVCSAIDLLFLQVVSLFEFVFKSKFSNEYKHDMKVLSFLVIKKLSTLERVKRLSEEINLLSIVAEKLNLSLTIMQRNRHLETTKKTGVQKCQYLVKDLVIFLKAFIEWNLPLTSNPKVVQEIFKEVLKVSDWIDADSVLMNCVLNLVQIVTTMDIGRNCVMMEINGKPLAKMILTKTQLLSSKPPHTENNLSLIRNGISALKSCSVFVDVRVMLKNSKIFQIFEVLHPQIYPIKKSTWDEVTFEWLKFFAEFSRFEDTECQPHNVSLLCRLFRIGNDRIKRMSLIVIRNFSLRASVGFVLISSEDFRETVDTILTDSSDIQEKFIILQTLLAIATKSDQLKAKLKNSSLNRKLKDQLTIMQSEVIAESPEYLQNIQIIQTLLHVLYPKE